MTKNSEETELSDSTETKKLEYTGQFLQRKLTTGQAALFVFFHWTMIGIVGGYSLAVMYSLQAKGASLQDQSTLSMSYYPYNLKFLFCPFLDRYYSSRIGKSKTYVMSGSLVLALLFLFLGGLINHMIEKVQINQVTLVLSAVNTLVCLVQVAGEAWVLTLFDAKHKTEAVTYLSMGQAFGTIVGYNIFTPLNDLEWLNDNIFTSHPRSEPLLSHTLFCLIVSALYFIEVVFLVFFISEQIMDKKYNKSLFEIFKVFPRHITNSHMRGFIGYMMACRIFYYTLDATLDFSLVRNGYFNLGRSNLTNIDTLTFPLVFYLSYLTVYYMKEGKLMRLFHLNMFFMVGVGLFGYLNYLDLISNNNFWRSVLCRGFSGIMKGMDFSTYFLFGFFNTIVNKSIGNTGLTCLIALLNLSDNISTTVGFFLTSYVAYDVMAWSCIGGQLLILMLLWPYSAVLDKKEIALFDLSKTHNKPSDEVEEAQLKRSMS